MMRHSAASVSSRDSRRRRRQEQAPVSSSVDSKAGREAGLQRESALTGEGDDARAGPSATAAEREDGTQPQPQPQQQHQQQSQQQHQQHQTQQQQEGKQVDPSDAASVASGSTLLSSSTFGRKARKAPNSSPAREVLVCAESFTVNEAACRALLQLRYLDEPCMAIEKEGGLTVLSATNREGAVITPASGRFASMILVASTRICFVYKRYHVVFALDATTSMYTVTLLGSLRKAEPVYALPGAQVVPVMSVMLQALLQPIPMPTHHVLLRPSIKVSVTVRTSTRKVMDDETLAVLVTAVPLSAESLPHILEQSRAGLDALLRPETHGPKRPDRTSSTSSLSTLASAPIRSRHLESPTSSDAPEVGPVTYKDALEGASGMNEAGSAPSASSIPITRSGHLDLGPAAMSTSAGLSLGGDTGFFRRAEPSEQHDPADSEDQEISLVDDASNDPGLSILRRLDIPVHFAILASVEKISSPFGSLPDFSDLSASSVAASSLQSRESRKEPLRVVMVPFFSNEIEFAALEPRVSKRSIARAFEAIQNAYPWQGRPPASPTVVRELVEYRLSRIRATEVLACRLKEGFSLKQALVEKHAVSLRFVLNYAPHVTIIYVMHVSRSAHCEDGHQRIAVVSVRLVATEAFHARFFMLRERLESASNPHDRENLSTSIELRLHQYINAIVEADRAFVHISAALRDPLMGPRALLEVFAAEPLSRWHRWFHVESFDVLMRPPTGSPATVEATLKEWATFIGRGTSSESSPSASPQPSSFSGRPTRGVLHASKRINGDFSTEGASCAPNAAPLVALCRFVPLSEFLGTVHVALPMATSARHRETILQDLLSRLDSVILMKFWHGECSFAELCRVLVSVPSAASIEHGLTLPTTRILVKKFVHKLTRTWPIMKPGLAQHVASSLVRARIREGYEVVSSSFPFKQAADGMLEIADNLVKPELQGDANFCKFVPLEQGDRNQGKANCLLLYHVSFTEYEVTSKVLLQAMDFRFRPQHAFEALDADLFKESLLAHYRLVDGYFVSTSLAFREIQAFAADTETLMPYISAPRVRTESAMDQQDASNSKSSWGVECVKVQGGVNSLLQFSSPTVKSFSVFRVKNNSLANDEFFKLMLESVAGISDARLVDGQRSSDDLVAPAAQASLYFAKVLSSTRILVMVLPALLSQAYDCGPTPAESASESASWADASACDDQQQKGEEEGKATDDGWGSQAYSISFYEVDVRKVVFPGEFVAQELRELFRYRDAEDLAEGTPTPPMSAFASEDTEASGHQGAEGLEGIAEDSERVASSALASAEAQLFLTQIKDAHFYNMIVTIHRIFDSTVVGMEERANLLHTDDIETLLRKCPTHKAEVDATVLRSILHTTLGQSPSTPAEGLAPESAPPPPNQTVSEVDERFDTILNDFFQPISKTSFYYFEPKGSPEILESDVEEEEDDDDDHDDQDDMNLAGNDVEDILQNGGHPSELDNRPTRLVDQPHPEPQTHEVTYEIERGRICETIMETLHAGNSSNVSINLIFCTLPTHPPSSQPKTEALWQEHSTYAPQHAYRTQPNSNAEGLSGFAEQPLQSQAPPTPTKELFARKHHDWQRRRRAPGGRDSFLSKWTKAVRKKIKSRIKAMVSSAVLASLQRVYPVTEKTLELVRNLLEDGGLRARTITRKTIPLHFVDPKVGVDMFDKVFAESPYLSLRKVSKDKCIVVEPMRPSTAKLHMREYSVPYWAIFEVTLGSSVVLYFHHPNLRDAEEARRIEKRLCSGVQQTEKRVNQLLLLHSLHETRSAHRLLIKPDTSRLSTPESESSRSHRGSPPRRLPSDRSGSRSVATNARGNKFGEAKDMAKLEGDVWNEHTLPDGFFACPCQHRARFPVPQRLVLERAINDLRIYALHSFNVQNRHNTFVYQSGDQIFYLKLRGESNEGEGGVSSARPFWRSSNADADAEPTKSSKAVVLEVYGVDKPPEDMVTVLGTLLENKIKNSTIATLGAFLFRNIQFKVYPHDLDFIKDRKDAPHLRHKLVVPSFVGDIGLLLLIFKENLLEFTNVLHFQSIPDAKMAEMEQTGAERDAPSPVPVDTVNLEGHSKAPQQMHPAWTEVTSYGRVQEGHSDNAQRTNPVFLDLETRDDKHCEASSLPSVESQTDASAPPDVRNLVKTQSQVHTGTQSDVAASVKSQPGNSKSQTQRGSSASSLPVFFGETECGEGTGAPVSICRRRDLDARALAEEPVHTIVVDMWEAGQVDLSKLSECFAESFKRSLVEYEFEVLHMERPIEVIQPDLCQLAFVEDASVPRAQVRPEALAWKEENSAGTVESRNPSSLAGAAAMDKGKTGDQETDGSQLMCSVDDADGAKSGKSDESPQGSVNEDPTDTQPKKDQADSVRAFEGRTMVFLTQCIRFVTSWISARANLLRSIYHQRMGLFMHAVLPRPVVHFLRDVDRALQKSKDRDKNAIVNDPDFISHARRAELSAAELAVLLEHETPPASCLAPFLQIADSKMKGKGKGSTGPPLPHKAAAQALGRGGFNVARAAMASRRRGPGVPMQFFGKGGPGSSGASVSGTVASGTSTGVSGDSMSARSLSPLISFDSAVPKLGTWESSSVVTTKAGRIDGFGPRACTAFELQLRGRYPRPLHGLELLQDRGSERADRGDRVSVLGSSVLSNARKRASQARRKALLTGVLARWRSEATTSRFPYASLDDEFQDEDDAMEVSTASSEELELVLDDSRVLHTTRARLFIGAHEHNKRSAVLHEFTRLAVEDFKHIYMQHLIHQLEMRNIRQFNGMVVIVEVRVQSDMLKVVMRLLEPDLRHGANGAGADPDMADDDLYFLNSATSRSRGLYYTQDLGILRTGLQTRKMVYDYQLFLFKETLESYAERPVDIAPQVFAFAREFPDPPPNAESSIYLTEFQVTAPSSSVLTRKNVDKAFDYIVRMAERYGMSGIKSSSLGGGENYLLLTSRDGSFTDLPGRGRLSGMSYVAIVRLRDDEDDDFGERHEFNIEGQVPVSFVACLIANDGSTMRQILGLDEPGAEARRRSIASHSEGGTPPAQSEEEKHQTAGKTQDDGSGPDAKNASVAVPETEYGDDADYEALCSEGAIDPGTIAGAAILRTGAFARSSSLGIEVAVETEDDTDGASAFELGREQLEDNLGRVLEDVFSHGVLSFQRKMFWGRLRAIAEAVYREANKGGGSPELGAVQQTGPGVATPPRMALAAENSVHSGASGYVRIGDEEGQHERRVVDIDDLEMLSFSCPLHTVDDEIAQLLPEIPTEGLIDFLAYAHGPLALRGRKSRWGTDIVLLPPFELSFIFVVHVSVPLSGPPSHMLRFPKPIVEQTQLEDGQLFLSIVMQTFLSSLWYGIDMFNV
ncbi:Hypothetical Protein FCC1311_021232 [Hondaea fermentalgiana]|uniref:Uncharacterized protein n=1 Tax=Hondaea fermentalgiana TaxID=2315210 RepID=A0A2R5GDM9_9STRA|nr:Hypothetical Protein FCC1311_021232 [Hondaea fermentalgiana]|eukprot:GBG25904.1 Hypothetical Protein FCC1311_021232 [Hondaea fermentalgiana]